MVSRFPILLAFLAAASPAASQTTPRQIAEVADISGLAASPDGRSVAYRIERPSTLTNRIDVDWYLARSDGNTPPVHLGRTGTAMWNDAGSILSGEAKWSPDGRSLVVRALIDGKIGLWETELDGSAFRSAVSGHGDIERFAFLPDGRLVSSEGPPREAIARAEEKEREIGILVDASVDLAQPLYRGASINGRPSSQRFTGDWFDRMPLLASASRRYSVRKTASGIARPARDEEIAALASAPPAKLAPEFARQLAKRGVCFDQIPCPNGALRLASRIALADGRSVITVGDRANRQSLFLVSPDGASIKLLARSAGLLAGGRRGGKPCVATQDALFCVEASAAIAPRLVRISFRGVKSIVDSPNPTADSDGLLAETIAWQVSGSRASGVLIRPKIPGRLPLFVTYYRCSGYLRGGTGDEWPLRAFAANGIAALCIDAVSGGTTAEERYELGLETIRAAIAHLSARGVIDPSRVGMGGFSFGSEVAMWTATHSDLLKAVSIASAQIEPAYYWFNARPGRESFAEAIRQNWKLGPPDVEPGGWATVSPALNVGSIRAPVLMQLPESEARQSIELMSKLAAARMGEMHIFPLSPHLKVEPRQKLAAYQRNLDWFCYWLKDEIDADLAKTAQYQRWARLGPKAGDASTARIQRSASAISSKRR